LSSRPDSITVARTHRGTEIALLLLVIGVGLVLRLFHLTYLALWSDETFSIYYYKLGLAYLWTNGLQWESSPPLYYMAIGSWIQVFGAGELATRSFSAVASSLAIPMVYALGCELFDRSRGLLAAAFIALSATQIFYAQEVRPYALLLLPVTAVLLTCARFLRQGRSHANLIAYTVGSLIAIYTHATGVFFVAACGLGTILGRMTMRCGQPRADLRAWIAANAVVFVLALPEMMGMLAHVAANRLAWIAPLTLSAIGRSLREDILGPLAPADLVTEVLVVGFLGVVAVRIYLRPPERRAIVVALGVPAIFVCEVVFASFFQPIILGRIFCWVQVPLSIILADVLLVDVRYRLFVSAITLVVLGVGLAHQLGAPGDAKEPWRSVIRQIKPDLAQADLVVVGPQSDTSNLMYYAPAAKHVRIWTEGLPPNSEDTVLPNLFGITSITRAEIIDRINTGARVILILRLSLDGRFLPLILSAVSPPQRQVTGTCLGRPCIQALFWQPPH